MRQTRISALWISLFCLAVPFSSVLADLADPPPMLFTDTDTEQHFAKDPTVVNFQGTYYLYYSAGGRSGTHPDGRFRIGIATSENLVDWVKIDELRWKDGAETNGFAAPGALVWRDQVHLFYQSYGNGPRDAICHAWSDDGVNFTRNANPVFRPEPTDARGRVWNSGRAIDANVIPHGDQLLLYWATRDPEHRLQMVGVSAAPLDSRFGPDDWTQLSTEGPVLAPELPWEKNCIEASAMARRHDRLYKFYGGAYNHERQQIGVAYSVNGLNFTRLCDQGPFKPYGEPGTWNSYEVGHPFYFQDVDGQGYLFYQGRAATEWGEDGTARRPGPYHLSMSVVRWEADPEGGPDRPVLVPHQPEPLTP